MTRKTVARGILGQVSFGTVRALILMLVLMLDSDRGLMTWKRVVYQGDMVKVSERMFIRPVPPLYALDGLCGMDGISLVV